MNKMYKDRIIVWVNMIFAILIILAVVFVGVGVVYVVNYGIITMYTNVVDLSLDYKHMAMIFNLNLMYILGLSKLISIIFKKYKKYYENK